MTASFESFHPIALNSVTTWSVPVIAGTPAPPFSPNGAMEDFVQKSRIVVVDDDVIVGRSIQSHLIEGGFRRVDLISEDPDALTMIMGTLPDVILLDVRWPDAGGWVLLETLRRDEKTQHIPIVVLTSGADEDQRLSALRLGANDFLTIPLAPSELLARIRNTLSAKVYRDLMTNYSLQLESDVLTDALTGIANRRAFEYELKRRIVDWNRQRVPLGLLLIDIDYFKSVNDRYGHRLGDAALHGTAQVLARGVREMDLVARYGGEEFAIILPATGPREARHAAERMRNSIASNVILAEGISLQLTVSVGSTNAMHGDDAELLVRRADTALYAAKRGGRNRSYYHDGAICQEFSSTLGEPTQARAAQVDTVHLGPYLADARIAIVDDEPHIIAEIRSFLHDAGFRHFIPIPQADQAVEAIVRCDADLVLLDMDMQGINGLQVLQGLREDYRANRLPVLLFDTVCHSDLHLIALALGAVDFLEKPIQPAKLLTRVRNMILAKTHEAAIAEYSRRLAHEVNSRTAELAASRREAIQCLARAAEVRDDHTGQHVLRVGRYSAIIAQELGFSPERVTWMEHAAQLHDVGKIGIPDSVLKKSGPLTSDEYEIMKRHCTGGGRIIRDDAPTSDEGGSHTDLSTVIFENLNSPVMRMAAIVAETHHERWDGTGYPRGLSGEDIPIEGRIAAVADVFDALSTQRPYKQPRPQEQCFTIMAENRGTHFDPKVVDAFIRRKSDVIRVYLDYADICVFSDSRAQPNEI